MSEIMMAIAITALIVVVILLIAWIVMGIIEAHHHDVSIERSLNTLSELSGSRPAYPERARKDRRRGLL